MARFPITLEYQPRTAERRHDALTQNVIAEPTGVRKRPGLSSPLDVGNVGQGLYWNGIKLHAIVDDKLYFFTPQGITENYGGYSAGLPSMFDNIVFFGSFYWVFGKDPEALSGIVHGYHYSSDGFTWTKTNYASGTGSTMESVPSITVHGGKMYILSAEATNVLYNTTNGADIAVSNSAVPVFGSLLSYDGKLWIITTRTTTSASFAVYNSTDNGVTWNAVTVIAAPAFGSNDLSRNCIVHNGVFYFSVNTTFRSSAYYQVRFRIYRSEDGGVTWVLKTSNSPVRAVLSHDGRIKGMSGDYDSGVWTTTLWSSLDGAFWKPDYTYQFINPHTGITPANTVSMPSLMAAAISSSSVLSLYYYWTYASGADVWTRLGVGTFTSTNTSLTSPAAAQLPFDITSINPSVSSAGIVLKSTKNMYYYDGSTLVKVTDADYPATTVPGLVYLDGTYYVMTAEGKIFGSAIDDPTSWSALNVIVAQSEPDGGIAIAKHVNYVVAFGAWSLEFFYNAGNPTGSPLLRVDSSLQLVGCASGTSVSSMAGTLFFIGVTKQRGRAVYVLSGTVAEPISSPYVDRILNADDMTNVYAFCIRIDGHSYYVVTLSTLGVTLFYDITTKQWGEWTSLAVDTTLTSVSVAAISAKTVTLQKTGHGLFPGKLIILSGSAYSDLNIGAFVETTPTADIFTISSIEPVSSAAVGSTITVTGYTEGAFIGKFYSYILGKDFLLDQNANLYEMSDAFSTDNGLPIKAFVRTPDIDGGTTWEKEMGMLRFVVAAGHGGSLYERHTDNDHVTYSRHRRAKILPHITRLTQLGMFTSRALEIAHIDPVPFQMQALDIDLET